MKKISGLAGILILLVNFLAVSQTRRSPVSNLSAVAFVQGTEAYKKGDWISSMMLFQKALSYPENYNDDTWYMLVTSEMYAGDYSRAYADCETFMQNFPESLYISHIIYHKGRALFHLGEYEKSILLLSDFCHQFPEHEMYDSAIYWIAESFYASCNYDEARGLYERIAVDFPDSSKAPSARYRLDSIDQRSREEKLLYLLKTTGEEYLSAKEEYERQLKMYGSETSVEARRRMSELQKKNADLELQNRNLAAENEELLRRYGYVSEKTPVLTDGASENPLIRRLKEKASETQYLLDEKKVEDAK